MGNHSSEDEVNGNQHYHCQTCNCTMTGPEAMDMHMNGKRHEKNVKKKAVFSFPFSDEPSTSNYQPRTSEARTTSTTHSELDSASCTLKDLLKNVKGPIVGLSGIEEFDEDTCLPQYNCRFCREVFTAGTIGPHLVSSTHKINYREARMRKRHRDSDSDDDEEPRGHHHHHHEEQRGHRHHNHEEPRGHSSRKQSKRRH